MYKKIILNLQNYFIIKKVFTTFKNNKINILADLKSSRISINGKNNIVDIQKGDFKRIRIGITGNNNSLSIARNSKIRNLEINIIGDNHMVLLGERMALGGASIVCCGNSSQVNIGYDCLLASNINIKSCDGHAIYKNNEIINNSKEINIGNNVWIAQDVNILKGVSISDNSVVGMNSLVTSGKFDANVIIAGIPAKVIKTGITWSVEGTL